MPKSGASFSFSECLGSVNHLTRTVSALFIHLLFAWLDISLFCFVFVDENEQQLLVFCVCKTFALAIGVSVWALNVDIYTRSHSKFIIHKFIFVVMPIYISSTFVTSHKHRFNRFRCLLSICCRQCSHENRNYIANEMERH